MTVSHQVAEAGGHDLAEEAGQAVSVGYKQTEVGVIPEDWETLTGEEITTLIAKGASPRWQGFSYTSEGMLFVTSENVRAGHLDVREPKYLPLAFHEKIKRSKLLKSDVLINLVGASIGRSCQILRDLGEANINQAVSVFRVKSAFNSKYVACYLNSPICIERILGMQVDAARPNISLGDLRRFLIPLPRIEEQTAIANALSDVDALINELEKLITKKQAIKTATMQQLLTGRTRLPPFALREDGTKKGYKPSELGEIPEDWGDVKIGDVCNLLTGFPFASNKYTNTGVRLLRGSNVKRNCTDWSDDITQYWSEVTPNIKQYELEIGDIVISMDGSLVGRSFAQLTAKDIPALLLQRVARLRTDSVALNYLKEWVCSKFFTEHCDSVKTVTAIPHISPQDIRIFKLLLPPTQEEQIAIATILSDMDTDIQTLQQRLTKTRQIKQGMMQELLTGRIRLVS